MDKKEGIKEKKEEKKKAECTPARGVNFYLIKFGRLCAWALLVMIILYFISGFGIIKPRMIENATLGIFGRGPSFMVHEWLTLPMAFAFLCHTLIAIRFAMIRWRVKNMRIVDYSFLATGILLFAAATYAYLA
jgi:hypothetical protein